VHHGISRARETVRGGALGGGGDPEVDALAVHRGLDLGLQGGGDFEVAGEIVIRDRLAALDQLDGLRGVEGTEAREPVRVDAGAFGGDNPSMASGDLREVREHRDRDDLEAGCGEALYDASEM